MGLLCFAIASACDPEIIVTRTEVVMNLPPGTCGATMRPTSLNLTALGYFPPGEGTLAFSRLDMGDPMPVDDFPFETEALVLRVQNTLGEVWESVRPLTGDPSVATLLLPPGRSCVVGDPEVHSIAGAAYAPTRYGGFVIVGGLLDPPPPSGLRDAKRAIVHVSADGRVATIHSIADRLSDPRAYATATRVGDYIVVAGGIERELGSVSDSYEVLDAVTGARIPELGAPMCPTGMGCTRRFDHGAAALSDGRVLIVGGVREDATVLASVIAIDPATGEVDEGYDDLTDLLGDVAPRRAPHVVTLDDGSVVIMGGLDSAGMHVTDMFYLPRGSTTPIAVVWPPGLPQRREGTAMIALPGARVAWLGGREIDGTSARETRVTVVLLESGSLAEIDDTSFGTAYTGLDNAHAIALEDGRIYATGDGQAFLFDTGRETISPLALPQDPRELLLLEDGTIVELGEIDSYFRRQLSPPRTRWDSPPGLGTLTLEDEEWLAIDAPSHVDLLTGSAMPGMTARVDVASAVFRDVAVTVIASGRVDLIFQEERGPAFTRVGVTRDQASVSGVCDLDMPCAEHVRIERRGAELVLVCPDTGAVKACAAFADPAAGLRVALRLYDDSGLEGITIERL